MKIFACFTAIFLGLVSGQCALAEQAVETVWSVDVDQRLPNSPVALSNPALVKHNQDTWAVLGGRDSWVHIYDLKSGHEIRRFYLGVPCDSGALALNNGLVVLGDIKGHLYGIDPVKGEIVWQKGLTAAFTANPVAIDNDFLVQTADNELYRFSADGEKRWSYSGLKNTLSLYMGAEPDVQGEFVYAVLNNGDAVKIKAYTGDLIWKRQTIVSDFSALLSDLKAVLAKPVLVPSLHLTGEQVENVLLVPVFHGELIVLASEDGSQAFSLPVSLKSSPLLLEDKMYVADSHGFLHLYNIKKGNRVWSKKISSHGLLGPVAFADKLWLTDDEGHVLKVNMNGEIEQMKILAGNVARLPIVTDEGLLFRTHRGEMVLVK